MIQVYCSGNLVADIQIRAISQLPPRDEVAFVDAIELVLGGNASNTAFCLAAMGIESGVIGCIGSDGFGRFIRQTLDAANVDTSSLIEEAGAKSSVSVAAIRPDGGRSCVHVPAATARFTARDFNWEEIESNLARSAHSPPWLHFSSFFVLPGFTGQTAAEVLARARRLEMRTSLDVCWDPSGRWAAELEPCLEYCDLVLPNLTEAQHITGRTDPDAAAGWFLDRGVRAVAIKLGGDGALIRTSTERVRVPAYRVEVVDTTAAGDAFAAGFLAGQIWGWDLVETARLATAAAALSVTDFGVRAVGSKEQVLEVMS
jgi:sugar/nucleoside kinase (ribokinase family)